MKKLGQVFGRVGLLLVSLISVASNAFAEDWKGKTESSEMSAGVLTGLGIIDGSSGYALLGTFSRKIVPHGFVPDINNLVSIEGAIGPVFLSGVTATAYSAHLRWDFIKDSTWTFYGLGGVGGNMMSVNSVSRFEMTPRFGMGAFFRLSDLIRGRAEISHDLVAVGVNFPF